MHMAQRGNRIVPRWALPLVLLAALPFGPWACSHGAHTHFANLGGAASPETPYSGLKGAQVLSETYGIELLSLRPTAEGHMLDLRYRVSDSEAALGILKQGSDVPIYLVDKKTGLTSGIPETMLGQLKAKSDRSRNGRIYYVLFGNPKLVVERGSTVEIHFGDVVIDRVPVL